MRRSFRHIVLAALATASLCSSGCTTPYERARANEFWDGFGSLFPGAETSYYGPRTDHYRSQAVRDQERFAEQSRQSLSSPTR